MTDDQMTKCRGGAIRQILLAAFLVATIVAALVVGGYAATKSYEFTGTVKSADGGALTVEKNARKPGSSTCRKT